jgi:hypothetical protein
MPVSTILLILLLLILVGALPAWGWHPYGYGPSGVVGLLLVVLLVLLLMGRI